MMRFKILAALFLPLALFVTAQEEQEATPPAPAVSLERGAYAEEYERDLETALAHYRLALATAQAMKDVERVKAARAAIERVERRQGQAPAQEDAEALRQQLDNRIRDVLDTLENTHSRSGSRVHLQRQAGIDLAVFGESATHWLEEFLDGETHEIEGTRIRLPASDIAGVLVSMQNSPGDAAMLRQSRSQNPHVRREIVRIADPERHHALLVGAASDAVSAVREAAIERLAMSPRSADAELFRAALLDGIQSAVSGLYALDSEAVVAGALAEGATESLRENVALRLLEDSRGAPSPAGARLLVPLALDPQDRWGTIRNELSGYLANTWVLPEPVRVAMEEEVLAHYAKWPSSHAISLLGLVGGLPSLEVLAVGDADGSATERVVARTPDDSRSELASLLNGLPVPASYSPIARGLEQLLRNVDATELVAFWDQLDEAHRPGLLRALGRWFANEDERLVGLAGGDHEMARRPGSMAAELLPLGQMLVRSGDTEYIVQGLRALQAIGVVEGLREALSFRRDAGGLVGTDSYQAAKALATAHPRKSRELIVQALLDDWRLRPGAAPIDVRRALLVLPDAQAVEAFRQIWPQGAPVSELRLAILGRLIDTESSLGATALLVENYAAIPEGASSWRARVLERVGEELYEPGLELLEAALRDPDRPVRLGAFGAYQAFRSQRSKLAEFEAWQSGEKPESGPSAQLMEMLESDSQSVQVGAIFALGAMRATYALPALVRLLESEDASVKKAVLTAIQRMHD